METETTAEMMIFRIVVPLRVGICSNPIDVVMPPPGEADNIVSERLHTSVGVEEVSASFLFFGAVESFEVK